MATSNWLKSQKKGELVELAQELGLEDYDTLKKTELEVALDDHLSKNSSTYASDSRFRPYYKRRSESSPVKKEVSSTLSDLESKGKVVKRRATKAAEDIANAFTNATSDDDEAEPATTRARAAAMARTPRASALRIAQNVPLPPSPAAIANAVDRNTAVIRSKVNRVVEDYGIVEKAEVARETISTVTAYEVATVLFEFYFLRKRLLPDRHAFTLPNNWLFRRSDYNVEVPDLFLLLTSDFWGPTVLWLVTTLFIPLATAYFYNLTAKPRSRSHAVHFNYSVDPLTFNITKALMVFLVFGQDVTFGGRVDLENVARINEALYGGWQGVLVGTGIGVIVTLYDALHKK